MMDMSQMMSAWNKSVSLESLMEMNRQNIEAASEASQCMAQGCSRLMTRRMEQLRDTMESYTESTRKMATAKTFDELMSAQSQVMQSAMQQSMNNFREMAEMTQEMAQETSKILESQMQNSVSAAQSAAKSSSAKSATSSKSTRAA